MFKRRTLTLALLLSIAVGCTSQDDGAPVQVDLLIRGGTIYDGSAGDPFPGDVGVVEDRIAFVGRADGPVEAEDTVDAAGLAVTPGFIDMHSHAELDEEYGRDAAAFLYQGITTVVLGLDGGGTDEVQQRFEGWTRRGMGVNAAYFVGHGYLRRTKMG